jgi:hypothetical protein
MVRLRHQESNFKMLTNAQKTFTVVGEKELSSETGLPDGISSNQKSQFG